MRFEDRSHAGRHLASSLSHLRDQDPIVVALPRGGVPVAYGIARALDAPLDVLLARKLGAPGHEELGIGAIAQGGASYLNAETAAMPGVTREYLTRVAGAELAEIDRRLRVYRGDRPPLNVRGRTAILVDDGLATGATTRAAIRSLRAMSPARSSSPCRSSRRIPRKTFAAKSTTSSAPEYRSTSSPWGSGTATSRRPVTTK